MSFTAGANQAVFGSDGWAATAKPKLLGWARSSRQTCAWSSERQMPQ
jgi:hypothetical protein